MLWVLIGVLQEKILWVLIDSALQEKNVVGTFRSVLLENILWVLVDVFCKKTDCGYSLKCFARKQILGTHRSVFKKTDSGYSLKCFARKHVVGTHWMCFARKHGGYSLKCFVRKHVADFPGLNQY